MSIRRKLTLTILGISIASVVLTVAAITTYLIFDIHHDKAHELEVMAALTADRNSAALVFLDNDRARKNLDIFHLNPSVLSACIYDASGALFAGYMPENTPGAIPCAARASGIIVPRGRVFTATKHVMQNGVSVGSVYIVSDTREIDAYVQKILLISGTATFLVLLATWLLTAYFQRTISAPILKLADTAQKITAEHNYALTAEANDADETGVLARAFNEMIAEIKKRDEELKQSNETLERRVAERTRMLEDAKRKAEAASEAKSEFLRNMSHEFRTPLHALVSFSAYGMKEYETAERGQLKTYFELMQKGAERLSRLVNEVLDLAKMEHGEHSFSFKPGDLKELAARSAELVAPLLAEKKLSLHFQHSGGPAAATCDHDKIMQVITNLLSNAIKFTPPAKSITIKTHAQMESGAPWMFLSVSDQGIGIPDGEQEMIFESFRQSSRTNTGAGGTGLGLAICRRIVEAHGGRIWAENNADGIGATVTFAIPAAGRANGNAPHPAGGVYGIAA